MLSCWQADCSDGSNVARNSRAYITLLFTVVIAATTVRAQEQSAAVRSDTGVQKILKRVPPQDQGAASTS